MKLLRKFNCIIAVVCITILSLTSCSKESIENQITQDEITSQENISKRRPRKQSVTKINRGKTFDLKVMVQNNKGIRGIQVWYNDDEWVGQYWPQNRGKTPKRTTVRFKDVGSRVEFCICIPEVKVKVFPKHGKSYTFYQDI